MIQANTPTPCKSRTWLMRAAQHQHLASIAVDVTRPPHDHTHSTYGCVGVGLALPGARSPPLFRTATRPARVRTRPPQTWNNFSSSLTSTDCGKAGAWSAADLALSCGHSGVLARTSLGRAWREAHPRAATGGSEPHFPLEPAGFFPREKIRSSQGKPWSLGP